MRITRYFQVIAFCFLLVSLPLPAVTNLAATTSSGSGSDLEVPENLKKSQVGDFVAPLNEQQVRQLLIEQLEIDAEKRKPKPKISSQSMLTLLMGINNPSSILGIIISDTVDSSRTYFTEVSRILDELSEGGGTSGFLQLLGIASLLALFSKLVEFLCMSRIKRNLRNRETEDPHSWHYTLGIPLIYLAVSFAGLIIFMLTGYILGGFVLPEGSTKHGFIMDLFNWIIMARSLNILYRFVFQPNPAGLGLIDSTINTNKLYGCMVTFTVIYIFLRGLIEIFVKHGFSTEHVALTTIIVLGIILNSIVFWFVWSQRNDIDRILFGQTDNIPQCIHGEEYPYKARALIWPTVVTILLTVGYLNWLIQLLLRNHEGRQAFAVVWWITLLFPLIDLLVTSILNRLVSHKIFQNRRFQQRKARFIFIIRSVIRVILLTILAVSMMEAWGIPLLSKINEKAGGDVVGTMTDVGLTIVIGFFIWEAIQLWMEKNLPEEEEEGPMEIEGEGGGAAATRTETLLPLFRTVLLILLVSIVIMSVLYSLGVQIGPLLAGASVVGIAIGFGSQKLVQDIISGMFFLIDDAFRKGEYVELAGMRGTIEKLSVRSMRLRHHLGAVQTIPYGEINTVKNLSRDWVIMKLELRLPYDVDIEKVRKIIKKVGQEMINDEILGEHMLAPLKSQGVMRVEESALIFRMKFTSMPGEQWVIRREAYTRVRNALADAGIRFAHREIKLSMTDSTVALDAAGQTGLPVPDKISQQARPIEKGKVTHAQTATQESDETDIRTPDSIKRQLARHAKIDDDEDYGDDGR